LAPRFFLVLDEHSISSRFKLPGRLFDIVDIKLKPSLWGGNAVRPCILAETRLSEMFTGDIEGESLVRALQVLRDDKSASLVSVQRFRGKLGGRQGTFVLQGEEIVENGKITATWFVVPGSGTGDLSGLRGEGGFEGDFGKGSDGTLDYWFE
jgi:hypothetical protein